MKKIFKFIKEYAFGFVIGAVIFSFVTVYAVNTINSNRILVDTTNIDGLTGNVTVQKAVEDLYKKECPSMYDCFKQKATPEVGDYIKMTPTSTSYQVDTTKTNGSAATINPSELNMWRVIKVNSDGTMEVVSENISSTAVKFKGQIGYKNLVGYLNVLANQYQNSKYTINARHMGYNGQIEYLTDTANTVDSTSTTAPWTCSTGGSCNSVESKGGGDRLYLADTNLVKNILGTLTALTPSGGAYSYWLASRYYYYNSSPYYGYCGLGVSYAGSVNSGYLYRYDSEFITSSYSYRLRPILTLKSGISYKKAAGIKEDPFVLE